MIFIVGTTNERGRCMLSSPAIPLAILTFRKAAVTRTALS
jgi:hypothetical protein